MDARQELALRKRLESGVSPEEELDIRRRIDSSVQPSGQESAPPSYLERVQSAPGGIFGRAREAVSVVPDWVPAARIVKESLEDLQGIQKDPQVGIPNALLRSSPVQFATGAARTMMGAGQLAEKSVESIPFVGKPLMNTLGNVRESIGLPRSMSDVIDNFRQKSDIATEGQSKFLGATGPSLLGSALDPGLMKVASLAKPGVGLGGRMLQAAKGGAIIGASQPIENADEDFLQKKLIQTGTSAVIAGAIPPVVSTVKGVGNWVVDFANAFRTKGAEPLSLQVAVNAIGKSDVPKVVNQLLTGKSQIPGDVRTAGDILSKTPAGSPIVALQNQAFKSQGGASSIAGEHFQSQRAVAKTALDRLNERMAPLKERIFANVNRGGGVNSAVINKGLSDHLKDPNVYANPDARKLSLLVQKEIGRLTRGDGSIAPEALHKFRTTGINKKVELLTKGITDPSAANRVKADTAGSLISIKKVIDDAIIKSGGKGWDRWLDAYSKQRGKISDVQARSLANMLTSGKYKPTQTTSLTGGLSVEPEFAKILSRPVVIANWILGHVSKGQGTLQSRINKALTKAFLNPQKLAADLARISQEGATSVAANRSGVVAGGLAAQQIGKQ